MQKGCFSEHNDLLTLPIAKKMSTNPMGQVLVIGKDMENVNILMSVCKNCGLNPKERFVFIYEARKVDNYNYNELQNNKKWAAIMVGSLPHSAHGKENSSSILVQMENTIGYPPVVRLDANGGLKITKSNFKKSVTELLTKGIISL
ncbi:MAG: hypothetical protein J5798_13970 [Spirochaetaceae bacterium]|nr:hypothetical protein [Spirochaetaceae bacterium]